MNIDFDINSDDAKLSFRRYDNGEFKLITPFSRHPNVLRSVIIGKKSWGLFLNQWTDGIIEWSFTREEILNQFYDNDIIIPKPLLDDFDNRLEKKRLKRNLEYYNSIK